MECNKKALVIARKMENQHEEASNLLILGLTYLNIGNVKKAIECLEESIEIGEKIEDFLIINACEEALMSLKISQT